MRPGTGSTPPPASSGNHAAARRLELLTSAWPALALGLLCYVTTLGHGFNYDDIPMVEQNPRIRALGEVQSIWLSDWWRAPEGPGRAPSDPSRDLLYRPLTLFSFACNHALHGLRPFGFHLVNVLLHAATCGLVWRFAHRLLGDRLIAAAAAAWFAVHPVHVEAVSTIVGRAELLATLFALLGLDALLPARGSPGPARLVLAAASLLAALLSKESAVSAPVIGWLLLFWRSRGGERTARSEVIRILTMLTPMAAYFSLRAMALEGALLRHSPYSLVFNPLVDAAGGSYVAGVLIIFGHYLRLLVLPNVLSSDYGLGVIDPHDPSDPMLLVGIVGVLALGAALLGGRSRHVAWRNVALLVTCFLLSYTLISNLVITIGVSAAERLFYWPSVFAIAAASVAIVSGWRRVVGATAAARSPVWAWGGGLVLLALAARSMLRATDWQDDLTLFRADTAVWPRSAQLHFALGLLLVPEIYQARDQASHAALLQEAATALDRALKTWPRFPAALRTRGEVFYLADDPDRARQYIETALNLDPRDFIAQRMLLRLRQPDSQPASQLADLAAAKRDTDNAALQMRWAEALLSSGDVVAALEPARRAAELEPRNPAALRLEAQALMLNSQSAPAIEILRRVLLLDPSDWEAHANLSSLLAETDPPASLTHAQDAARLRPDDLRVRINLAEALAANGHTHAALEAFLRIERDLPAGHPFTAAIRGRVEELRRRSP